MRNRGVGGILVALWLVTSIASFAQSELLYLNEEPLSLSHPMIQQADSLLVPLEEFCPLIGLSISYAEDDIILRGSGSRQAFDVSAFPIQNEIVYVSLNWILEWVGGEIHQVGGDIYLRTERPQIVEIEASANQVTVSMTGFSSHAIAVSQQGLSEIFTVSWPHGELGLDAQLIRVGESDIQAVRMVGSSTGVELLITLEPGTILATEQLETDEFYALTLRVAETASVESIIEVGEGIAVHEWGHAASNHIINYVYVEAWRDRFRLQPAVPVAGYQSSAVLQAILLDTSAVAAISLDCPWEPAAAECLIMNGIPYLVPDTPSEVLAIDLFGRWSTFSSLCSVDVKHAGQLIGVDGVNRPLAYGEVLVYTSGYDGDIVRGIPGSFAVIKIRENRVVSVYQGPYVPEDASAILLVASGEAKAVLSAIQLGDPIEVVCQFLHADGAYPYAVSSGPQVMGDGTLLLSNDSLEAGSLVSSGTVLACDWQGGLYLLTFEDASAEPEEIWSLIDILYALPTVLKDAVLLSS
ncbi:MAG: hypothetical protein KAQ74_03910, partial [Dehalococcoidia bacterium]|nr:hypothetical protein [Dehalococcoidia bacterium]